MTERCCDLLGVATVFGPTHKCERAPKPSGVAALPVTPIDEWDLLRPYEQTLDVDERSGY